MENKLYQGSICVTDLLDQLKSGHSSFTKSATNGKIYCNILLWENKELDKYGNSHSVQLNSKKELKDKEEKAYVGNCKPIQKKEGSQNITQNDIKSISIDTSDVPF